MQPGRECSTLLVAGPGAHHAIAAAIFEAAAHRDILGLAEMRIDGPAERAAGVLGVDRHGGAAAPHDADDLAMAVGAFGHRGNPGVGLFVVVEAIAIGAAGSDREGACGFRGADGEDQKAEAGDRIGKITQKLENFGHQAPPPRNGPETTGEGFRDGESPVIIPGPRPGSGRGRGRGRGIGRDPAATGLLLARGPRQNQLLGGLRSRYDPIEFATNFPQGVHVTNSKQ
jgi:hypothetical protein